MNPFRRQLAVYSPLSWRAVLASLATHDARPEVERAISSAYGAPTVLLTDSGTTALSLALRVFGELRPGGSVLLPGFGCFDLATAALGAGVPVTLYDVEPTSLAPRLDSLASLLTPQVAALVLVTHYGVPFPLEQIVRLARAHGVPVIDDAAQAAGASRGREGLGLSADATILSFGRGKGVTAGAGGAVLLGGHVREADRVAALLPPNPRDGRGRIFPSILIQHLIGRPSLYALPSSLPFAHLGETVFRAPGPLQRMTPAAARVLTHSLSSAESSAAHRRYTAQRLRAVQSAAAPASLVQVDRSVRAGWLRLPVLTRDGRAGDVREMRRLGIARSYPIALDELDPLRGALTSGATPLPGARELARRLVTLPTHELLREDDLTALEQWIRANLP